MDKANRTLVPASPRPEPIAPAIIDDGFIKSRIFTIRGVQVMLDRELAVLYGVEVKQLNRQVKRNIERFPQDFMFQLSREECLRCQIGTINGSRGQHLKYMPYAFSENGVAMLSGVLRSSMAIEVNIRIMRVFTAMRRALASLAPILARIEEAERRQLEEKTARLTDQARNEERFDTIFKAMDGGDFPPQKVFYDGQVYADRFHDRFLILDRSVLIHVGASLNHLGKRCFAFSSLDKSNIPDLRRRFEAPTTRALREDEAVSA